jgi:GNAT superfamily N-acetyltransferase
MMEVTAARPGDVPALAELLAEMGRFYGEAAAGPLDERTRRIGDALFASPPAAHALLAWDGTELAGMAAYSFLWPAAGLTRSLYLKELYVGERYRRRGAGKLLMQALFEMAGQCGCSRVEWTTDSGNVGAQAFYEMLRLPRHPSKVFYRAEGLGR